jgi:negative regulator of flagellin synthesis FlgM
MSSQLQALETKVAVADSFEVKKVEAIKSAILDGQFTINPDKVADGLISTVKELLATQKT